MADDEFPEEVEATFYGYVYINQYAGAEGLSGDMSIKSKTMEINYFGSAAEGDRMAEGYELSEFLVRGETIQEVKIFIDGVRVDAIMQGDS